jgi:hypothetical protein
MLDVLFYLSEWGDKVRVDACQKIVEAVKLYGQGNVHIVAHSLGTAVVLDALHWLFRHESDPDQEYANLRKGDDRIDTLWMFANVSRLVNTFSGFPDPFHSVVNPSNNKGCLNNYYNIRHQLDPFTYLWKFRPDNDGRWVSEDEYFKYLMIKTETLVDVNTHSFSQYVSDPEVAQEFFYRILPPGSFKVSVQEANTIRDLYKSKSLEGQAVKLKDAFKNIDTEPDSWVEFVKVGLQFSEVIRDASGKNQ